MKSPLQRVDRITKQAPLRDKPRDKTMGVILGGECFRGPLLTAPWITGCSWDSVAKGAVKKSVADVQDNMTGSNHVCQLFCPKRAMLGGVAAREDDGLIQLFISNSHSPPIVWLPPSLQHAVEKAGVISAFPNS